MPEGSEKIFGELRLHVADQADLDPILIYERGAASEIEGDDGQRFVHRHDEVAGPIDALAVAESLRK